MRSLSVFPYKLVSKKEKRYNYMSCKGCHSEYILSQPPWTTLYCRCGNIIINYDATYLMRESAREEIEYLLENAPEVIKYYGYANSHCPYCNHAFREEDRGYVEDGEEKEVWYLVFPREEIR